MSGASRGMSMHMSGRKEEKAGIRAARLLPALAAAALLAACGTPEPSDERYVPLAAYERYPIAVSSGTMRLEVPARAHALSAARENEIRLFAQQYVSSGEGPVTIDRPSGGGPAAAAVAADITQAFIEAGVSERRIVHRSRRAPASAPVVLSFRRYVANTAECGDWSQSMTETYKNGPTPNLGCASQHNLAAMVANPRDLITPRASEPADAARRDVVLQRYREGVPTATSRGDQDSGTVSTVDE